jgi:CRISPR-associated protein Cas1
LPSILSSIRKSYFTEDHFKGGRPTWLADRNIPLVRVDWRGNAVTVLGNSYGLNPECVKSQLRAQGSADALRIASSLIRSKLQNCLDTLATLPESIERTRAIDKHKREISLLKKTPLQSIAKLLGIEGAAALNYFAAWKNLRINWRILKSRPIPVSWLTFESRSSQKGKTGDNVGATHPINACLNYAYAILESHVRMDVVSRGYDPTIGYLHTYKQGRDAFVLDLMEPLRAIVDRALIQFVQTQEFRAADFTIRSDGVCRLNAQLAKRVSSFSLKYRPESWPPVASTN